MKQIHFNRDNFSFALSNILEHKFRSLLTILGIIVGIVTVVLVASVLVGVRNNIALLFQEFGPDSIFAFHLNGDPGGTDIKPEERSRKPLRAEFAAQILNRCPSVKDAAAQIYVPNLVKNRPLTAKYGARKTKTSRCRARRGISPRSPARNCRRDGCTPREEEQRYSKVCVLGANIASSLFPSSDAVGKRIVMDGARVRGARRIRKAQRRFCRRKPTGQRRHDSAENNSETVPGSRHRDSVLPGLCGTARCGSV